MELTVIGRSGACPNTGEACSGYLVQQDQTQLLLDCGTGVVGRLRELVDFRRVSAVLISHMHFDHFADLIPYTYGLKLGVPLGDGYRPRLFLPPGGREVLGKVVEQWADLLGYIYDVFQVQEFVPDSDYRLGPLTVTFRATRHFVPCWGIQVAEEGKRLVYSADAGPDEELALLAAKADVFLCEAALEVRTTPKQYGHLTAREAGEIAADAGAKKLLLTHFWEHFDLAKMLSEARGVFKGQVEIAEEMKAYPI